MVPLLPDSLLHTVAQDTHKHLVDGGRLLSAALSRVGLLGCGVDALDIVCVAVATEIHARLQNVAGKEGSFESQPVKSGYDATEAPDFHFTKIFMEQ